MKVFSVVFTHLKCAYELSFLFRNMSKFPGRSVMSLAYTITNKSEQFFINMQFL